MLIIHPDWAKQLEKKPSDNIYRNLVKACEEQVMSESNPVALILKLQVYFDLNYRNASQFFQERDKILMSRVQPVFRKLVSKVCSTQEEFQSVHDDIVTYVMLQENVAQPWDAKKFKEVQRTVITLLPLTEINKFTALNKKNKKKYLQELASIVSGIYFYKWREGRGHTVVTNALNVISTNVLKLFEDLSSERNDGEHLVDILEGMMIQYFVDEVSVKQEDQNAELQYLKSYLTFLCQYLFFLNVMINECSQMISRCRTLIESFKKSMDELRAGLSSTAASSTTLFSLYSKASQNWKSMKAELVFLKHFMGIFENMKDLKRVIRGPYDEEAIRDLQQDLFESSVDQLPIEENEETDIDYVMVEVFHELQDICNLALSNEEESIKIIYPSAVSNFKQISLQFEGFCPWALLKGRGLLVRGKRNIGILMHEGQCYTFSSVESLKSFCGDFSGHLSRIRDIIREQPQLILLLKLHHIFHIQMCNEAIYDSMHVEPIFISSMACQTVDHPVEKCRVYEYKWNQWELRRQALKYLEIKSKQTHSTQTDLSHFRRDNFSQVYLPKSNATQTKRNLFTVMPRDVFPVIFRDT